ncbi:MAG TPA: class I SAM-dependent methyltransferase [Candidatus Cloacimonadota bacterium]|nr:class I SAM-dependent methyltransferase [Candidatus Cloacimonadota bacterium]HQL14591.1 class I SAM-dependent methyltransferase [Candidatus Cloacimonadota bacterium]
MQDVFKLLKHIDGGKVLDAACGKGDFINVIKQNFKSYEQIIGVDSSEICVKQAQNLFPENNIEIYRMDLEQLDFADNYFDTVCISNSLHHLENKERVLHELMRVLKSGGLFVIQEMYSDGKQNQAQQTHILMHHWFAEIDTLNNHYHRPTYTRQELIDLFDSLELDNTHLEDYYIPVDNPADPKVINPLLHNVKDRIKKCQSLPSSESLCEEGQKILERLTTIGYMSASKLLFTGRKK